MEAGINADQNFYRRQFPQSSDDSQGRRDYEQAQLADYSSRPPQVPPKVSLATNNLQTVAANGYGAGDSSPAPDDFYREYRGIQSASGYNDIDTNGILTAMSTATTSRTQPSSFRSNSNGTTPKHPQIPTSRSALKAPYRSPSAPIDEKMALNTAKSTSALNGHLKSQQPSVKDLLRRFDQGKDQTTSSARKPLNRTPANGTAAGGLSYTRSRSDVQGQTSTLAPKAGQMTRDTTSNTGRSLPMPRSTQRNRFSSEDQESNNTLSSMPRAPRRHPEITGNSQASQSMINLSPEVPPKSTSQIPARRPLFGEVVPEESGIFNLGFGITDSRVRRTSDSSLHPPSWRRGIESDTDFTASSPTAWYRGATPSLLDDTDPNKTLRQARSHTRSRSDFAGGKTSPAPGTATSRDLCKSPPIEFKTSSNSRLPVSSKRLSNQSESSSPPLSRATSPSKPTALVPNIAQSLKPDSRPFSPAGRSTTPTSRLAGRHSPSPAKLSTSNSSLKAYISAPPPKLSPPLRSSRPRLPVSSATTASSRARISERPDSPERYANKAGRSERVGMSSAGHAIGPGAVDFAARRERIQRAYSKSIQESEEKELREAKLRRESMTEIFENSTAHARDTPDSALETSQNATIVIPIMVESPSTSLKLEIDTSFLPQDQASTTPSHVLDAPNPDSPTLGIPGSFPNAGGHSDEDEIYSAVSNTTGFTEIDNEPQTEPPRHSRGMSLSHAFQYTVSTENSDLDLSTQSALTTPNDSQSIQILFDTMSVEEPEENSTEKSIIEEVDANPRPPPSTSLGYGDPVFTSTSHMQMLEDDIDRASGVMIEPAEMCAYEQGSVVQDGSTFEAPDFQSAHSHADLVVDHGSVQTKWDSQSQLTSPYALPKLQTSLDTDHCKDPAVTPITAIDSESSDEVDNMDKVSYGNYDANADNVEDPRKSQQSVWTDYSFSTTAESIWQGERELPLHLSHDGRPQPPPKETAIGPEVPPKPVDYSPQISPQSAGDTPRLTSSSRDFGPALSQSYQYGTERLSSDAERISWNENRAVPPIPAWPNHSPPPPPSQSNYFEMASPNSGRSPPSTNIKNRSASSVYRSNHDPESRRESADELTSSRLSVSTPISSTRISINEDIIGNQPIPGESPKLIEITAQDKELQEKQAKKLQHRGRVIKELIDTESVYLKDMNVVEEIYKGTAEACPKLEPGDIKTIFRNTDQIITFSTMFLDELKAASASVYSPRSQKSRQSRNNTVPQTDDGYFMSPTPVEETEYDKDRKTRVGEYFGRHLKEMQDVYTDFLKSSEQASNRLAALQTDPAVKVWLTECNTVAKELTAAWDLDALLIKPVQRITRYQLLLNQLLDVTPDGHPDHKFLQSTYREVGGLLKSIDDLKKRIDTVNKIVGRKRKDSDVRSGLAKAFGRSRDKSISNTNRPPDDEAYMKVHERFADDYLRLQVVLRDVEYYTRHCNTYVSDFLRYLSAMELVMRVSASPYPELESKWARFNMSMRDMGSVALEDHVSAVRKLVIEPFEQVIKAYGPPDLAMKKRKKRRLDYERFLALKAAGKKIDDKLNELVEQYEALNETLKFELPKLSLLTAEIGRIGQRRLITLQVEWFGIWVEKVKTVLEEKQMPKDVEDILDMFHRDYKYQLARIQELSIANGTFLEGVPKSRFSHSTTATKDDDSSTRSKHLPPAIDSRSRGISVHSDHSPSLPTPDFVKRHSGPFTFSPIAATGPGVPHFSTRDYPPMHSQARPDSGSPGFQDPSISSRPYPTRPSTGRSADSGFPTRRSVESGDAARSPSGSAYYTPPQQFESIASSSRPFSGLFHSAMPTDDFEDSQRSSRTSSHDRERHDGYNVLYLAASLFEFNISATKSEAGYPYLTYQAGEIFDVIGEKGELWLAKNQDDPTNQVGWIWSKHFARLATD